MSRSAARSVCLNDEDFAKVMTSVCRKATTTITSTAAVQRSSAATNRVDKGGKVLCCRCQRISITGSLLRSRC